MSSSLCGTLLHLLVMTIVFRTSASDGALRGCATERRVQHGVRSILRCGAEKKIWHFIHVHSFVTIVNAIVRLIHIREIRGLSPQLTLKADYVETDDSCYWTFWIIPGIGYYGLYMWLDYSVDGSRCQTIMWVVVIGLHSSTRIYATYIRIWDMPMITERLEYTVTWGGAHWRPTVWETRVGRIHVKELL